MKKTIILLLSTFLLISCGSFEKKETKPIKKTDKKDVKKEIKKEETVVKKSNVIIDNNLLIVERAPCSGDCPVFKVTVSKDKVFTNERIEGTAFVGEKTINLTDTQYAKLTNILSQSDFKKLQKEYKTSRTKDYADTKIKPNGKTITVRLWKDAPKKLTDISVFIEDILYDQKYLE